MGNRMEQQQPSSFPYLFLLLCFLVKLCTASDTITANQSITDPGTLVSSEGNFTLGFFSPGTSQKRYVGIWFTKVSIQTVVWVANRENPITGSSGVLKIGSDGNLVVLNRTNSVIWSSNVSSVANNSTAQILDSGNLVLSYGSSVVWQSFDNPCDTALPDMIISSNLTGGANISLSSWSDSDDPSRGSFDLRVDPRDYRQIFVWKNSSRYWRSGQWDGQIFTGVPEMTNVYQNGIYLVGQRYEYQSDTNAFSRFVMNSTGAVQEFIWNEEIEEWTTRWSQPTQSCQFYNYCGSNGYCSNTSSPICACFPGFEAVSSKDWVLGNWSSGCYRSTQFQCQKNISSLSNGVGNGFWKLTEVKLPDSAGLLTGVEDINICESECTKNCSCIAFAFVNGIGCMVWDGDLMDIQQFSEDGQDLYIRLADSELEKLKSGSNKTRLAVIISVSCIVGMVLLGACAYFLWKVKLKQKGYWKKGIVSEQSVLNSDATIKAANYFSDENNQADGINCGKCPDLPLFDLSTLEASTDNFCKANKLGEGGFGPVYKGTLPGGTEIAIKRLSRSSGQGLEEFKNEVRLISKLQHRNLVRLLGCCAEGDEKMLIYEYMPNKSLDAFIFDPKKRAQLDWRKRHHIIEGIARGLLYLHRDSRLRIIHRDLKAGNILLDSEMNPKISDFGMARIFGGNQIQENTNRVVGTYGYMSPEYAMEGLFSEKSDVFSFGVLLLEIVSGKKNNAFCDTENSSNLLGFSRRLWNEDKGLDLMDPLLQDSHSTREVLRCIHVGLLCTQDAAVDRPSMPFVVAMLGTEDAYLPMPTQLEFSAENNPIEINSSRNSRAVPDTCDLTITAIEGR